MKTTIDIPAEELEEAMNRTNAKTKREAILHALRYFNKSERYRELTDMLGTFEDFMTQDELRQMREDEKKQLARLDREMLCLPTTDEAWDLARKLAQNCRGRGRTVPATNLIVAACAFIHDAEIEHCDAHFDTITAAYTQ